MKRLLQFTLIMLVVWSVEIWWLSDRQPEVSTKLALRQFDSTDAAAATVRQFEVAKDIAPMLECAISVLAAWACFGSQAKTVLGKIKAHVVKATPLIVGLLCIAGLTGCMKPYDKPEFVEIDTADTGFLI